jgi:hypothetical protein
LRGAGCGGNDPAVANDDGAALNDSAVSHDDSGVRDGKILGREARCPNQRQNQPMQCKRN